MTKAARHKILALHTGRPCPYCGVLMTRRRDGTRVHESHATIEHIVPTSRGGLRDAWVVACWGCNTDKGNLTLNEWRAALSIRYTTVCVFWFERRIPRTIFDSLIRASRCVWL